MVLESVDAGGRGDPQRAVDLNRLGFFRQIFRPIRARPHPAREASRKAAQARAARPLALPAPARFPAPACSSLYVQ